MIGAGRWLLGRFCIVTGWVIAAILGFMLPETFTPAWWGFWIAAFATLLAVIAMACRDD